MKRLYESLLVSQNKIKKVTLKLQRFELEKILFKYIEVHLDIRNLIILNNDKKGSVTLLD